MHPRRLPRTALPAAAAILCGLLASCSTGSASPAAGGTSPARAPQVSSVSLAPTVNSSPKTLPPSRLCTVLDQSAAGLVLTAPKQAPRVAPNKGTAEDSCSYASGDGAALLTLNPSARSYETEISAAHSLVRDPASAGMSDVKVTEVDGLGQGAFSESAEVLQPRQSVAYVVWRAGSRTWVLTLALPAGSEGGVVQLVPLARKLTPRLT
ncbi:hypothetical protein [Streptomyces sp. CoH27]|uniref:hypothetical protein n=1 Tax=Streptomyces sp. CoH27 TaxID=2875763 RepID=UPI001CD54921|nr:hypothetical protein [Streptomyces sp. CoH27]